MSISKLLVENWRSFINEQDASLGEELLQIIQGIQGFENAVIKSETFKGGGKIQITNLGSRGERQHLMNTLAEKFPKDIQPLTKRNGETFRIGKYKG